LRSTKISEDLASGNNIAETQIDLKISTLKPLHCLDVACIQQHPTTKRHSSQWLGRLGVGLSQVIQKAIEEIHTSVNNFKCLVWHVIRLHVNVKYSKIDV